MEWVKYRYSLFSSAVERQPFKLVVEGSIPSGGALFTAEIRVITIRRLRQGGYKISKKTNLEETLMNIFIKNDKNKMSMKNRKKLMISIVSDLYSKDKKGEKFKNHFLT